MTSAKLVTTVVENNGNLGRTVFQSTLAKLQTAGVISALVTAIEGVSVGKFRKASYSVDGGATAETGQAPANAQRGQKGRITGICSATGVVHGVEVPCLDPLLVAQGGDTIDITTSGSPGLALAQAINAIWTDVSGNPITVSSAKFVNRSIQ